MKMWKKGIGVALAVGMVTGLNIPVLAEEVEVAPTKSSKIANLEASLVEQGIHKEYIDHFVLVHTNDSHTKVEEGKYDGMGMAKVSGYVNLLEKVYGEEDILLLDGGDTLHGIPLITTTEGEAMTKIMDIMEYDAMVAGNHDFNYGYERLIELDDLMTTPILSANVTKDGENILDSYIIKDVDGKKVGIFGLSTPSTTTKTHPNNVKGLVFEDTIEAAKAMVKELKTQEVDVIIALAHLGLDEDSLPTSEDVAEAVEGIDIIVDGHSHTSLPKGKYVGETLIVQAGEYTKNIGQVHVFFKEDGTIDVVPFHVTKEEAAAITPDTAVTEVIEGIKVGFEALTAEVVGETTVKLDGEREIVRCKESNLGNLVTNAILEITGADVAFTNGGGLRASIDAGEITKKDVITVLPFGNTTVMIEVTGQEIKDALEIGVAKYPETNGAFPQVAGMSYTFDANLPEGSRVTEVLVGGQAIDLAKTYTLGTNDFLAAGGDGYTLFEDNKIAGEFQALDEVVIQYLQEKGTANTEVQGRITIIEAVEEVQ